KPHGFEALDEKPALNDAPYCSLLVGAAPAAPRIQMESEAPPPPPALPPFPPGAATAIPVTASATAATIADKPYVPFITFLLAATPRSGRPRRDECQWRYRHQTSYPQLPYSGDNGSQQRSTGHRRAGVCTDARTGITLLACGLLRCFSHFASASELLR